MVLSHRQATLYLLLGYISWQLHEIGYWLLAKAFGGKIVMGFDRWCLIQPPRLLWAVLAAGPLTTLLLALISFVLLTRRGSAAEEVGFSLAFFNSVFGISSLAWGLATNPTHLEPPSIGACLESRFSAPPCFCARSSTSTPQQNLQSP